MNRAPSLPLALLLAPLALTTVEGCGKIAAEPGAALADGQDDWTSGAPPGPPAACSDVGVDGVAPYVTRAVVGRPPTPTGGAIEDGDYVLVEQLLYGKEEFSFVSGRQKLRVRGGQVATGWERYGTARTGAETWLLEGSRVTMIHHCPSAVTQEGRYSVVTEGGATRLEIHVDEPPYVVTSVFVRAP